MGRHGLVEDVLLRTAEPEVYDQWVAHEIPFDHPKVVEAAEIVGDIWFAPDYVYGGNTGINATFVGDTQNPMFAEEGPGCWMHKQAAWIPDFWPVDPDTEEPLFTPGEDSAFFFLPPIDDPDASPVARILAEATTLRFDASDTMPADVGQGTFWSGMIEWISANGEGIEQVLADIEASWPAS